MESQNNNLLIITLALAGALLLALIFAMWQIGRDRIYTLLLILTSGVAITLLTIGAAVAIRMWRKNDSPPVIERHFTDGTRTIVKEVKVLDGRAPSQTDVKLLQLPAAPSAGAFPEILRAAFSAGATALPSPSTHRPDPGYIEAEIDEQDLADLRDWGDGWEGDIRG